jgi:hypothetical protein
MRDEMSEAIAEVVNRVEPDHEMIAKALAADISTRTDFDTHAAVEAGVAAAIEEIDDGIFDEAVEAVQLRVHAAVEADAKRAALRMLRELASQARHEEAAAS